ncbi:hypothetical protein [Legionella hackeliae]|uniref:Lipoprotein n=1 Tax=Legionella hackeliae TaxID=449 RepID=A0A0A8UW24_LEGHA|nr:hypothetical protein [Legionella hackeliae]KTD15346.1 hypothetical protein Lhac_0188 [Legionella hackeliae]CEK11287.1 exported protein of unknown function [Legionella hackeliae]STX48056.1 Uncharacterised protein [Legionella hackeliae]
MRKQLLMVFALSLLTLGLISCSAVNTGTEVVGSGVNYVGTTGTKVVKTVGTGVATGTGYVVRTGTTVVKTVGTGVSNLTR